MDNSIINEGSFSKEEIEKYYKMVFINQTIPFTLVGCLFLFAGILFLIFKFTKVLDLSFLIYIILGCGILIIVLPLILVKFIPKIIEKQNKGIIDGFNYKYEFFNDKFKVLLNSNDLLNDSVLKYSYIYQLKQFDDVLFIYLNSNVVYMLKLNLFSSEEEKDKALSLLSVKKGKK